MKILEKLAKQSAIYGISTILGRLLSYLLTPYYTRLFAPSEYGVITDIYSLIPFALVVLTLGMESSYFRFATKVEITGGDPSVIRRGKDRLFATTWGITSFVSLLFVGSIMLFASPISALMGEVYVAQPHLVVWVAWVVLFDVVMAVPFARLREQGRSKSYVILKLLNIVLQVSLAILFGSMGLFGSEIGVGWVVIANLIASVVTLIVTLVVLSPLPVRGVDVTLLRRILIYSFPLLLSGVAATATDFIDRQLIKYLTPSDVAMAQLGIYGAVTKIAVVMTLFTQMYRLAAEPLFLSNFSKDEFVESNAAAMKYYIMTTVAIFLGITLFRDLFALIVGRSFRVGIDILPVVLLSNLLMGVWLNLSFWYKREEKTAYALYITLFGLVVSIVANVLLIPRFGYEGAAWARLVCEVAMVGVSYILLRRHFPIPYEMGRIAEFVVLGGGLYWVSRVVEGWSDSLSVTLVSGVVLLLIYIAYAVCREGLLKLVFRR